MKSFYREIVGRLEQQSNELEKIIEPQHKELIRNSYICMSNCYKQHNFMEESNKCAEKCHENVKKAQQEVHQTVEDIQKFFHDCMHHCKGKKFNHEDEVKECITNCTDQATAKFSSARKKSQEIMARYGSYQ